MKAKFLVVVVLLAATLLSCGNKHCSAKIENHVDSVNYMFGLLNGSGIRMQYLGEDTSDEKKVKLFCKGFEQAWSVTEGDEFTNLVGCLAGASLASEIESGYLFNDTSIPAKKDLIVESFKQTIKGEPFCMEGEEAMLYLQTFIAVGMEKGEPCNPTAGQVDTLNMCLGFFNARQYRSYILGKDTTDSNIRSFIKGFKKGIKMDEKDEPLIKGISVALQFTMDLKKNLCLFGDESITVEWGAIGKGVIDGVSKSKNMLMSVNEAADYIQNMIKETQEKKYAAQVEEGRKFLDENAKNDSVKVTESGLQYKVIKEGNGEHPTATSTVKVHYTGKFIDGTVFDSSVERGEPAEFPLNGVIKGWTEGLQLMTVGSKYILYVPYELGYGASGREGAIPPCSTLIFEVELLEITK